jgi:predicted nucleotidyltransferase
VRRQPDAGQPNLGEQAWRNPRVGTAGETPGESPRRKVPPAVACLVAVPYRALAVIDDIAIVEILHREFPDAVAIYRFGSTVDGGVRAESDIDIAFLPDHPIDSARRFSVQETLAARLRRDVDLVDLASVSTVLRMQVVSTGKLLATFDGAKREVFEDYVFSSYARLNEERREILEQIARDGRVYNG